MLLTSVMLAGIYIDVWSHRTQNTPETFFTVWHGLFYTAFLAAAAWLGARIARFARDGAARPVPVGYDAAVAGFVVFAAGGLGDLIWHTLRGIERSLEALMSAPHLMLMTGGVLILCAPYRAAWLTDADDAPRYRPFLPALIGLSLSVAMVTLLLMFHWGFEVIDFATITGQARLLGQVGGNESARDTLMLLVTIRGYTSILISNVVLFAPLLLLLRRWHPPFGTAATYLGVIATFMSGLAGFHTWEWIPVAAGCGLFLDLLIQTLRPSPRRLPAFRLFALTAPVVLWATYLLAVDLGYGLAWEPEITMGTVMWTALTGWGLSVLVAPVGEA